MTRFNDCATYRAFPRAKTMQRLWTPALHQYATLPPHIRFSQDWSHTLHRKRAHPPLQHQANPRTTHQLIVNYQHDPILLLMYLNLQIHHQPIPERQPPIMRPPTTPHQIMLADIGTTTPIGTAQRIPVEIVVHLIVKVTLEINIAKAKLDPALRHTITPDLAGKHFITEEYIAIWWLLPDRDPVSLVAPTDSFGVTMLLPTFGIWATSSVKRYMNCGLHTVLVSFSPDVSHSLTKYIMSHTFPTVRYLRITFSPPPQILVSWSRSFRPTVQWLLSTSWRPKIWSLSLAKTWPPSLLHSRIVRAHLIDLNMAGIKQYLCSGDPCILQCRPLVLFGILLAYLLHHRRLHRFHRAQHGLSLHHLSHLHLRSPNNLSTTPILHLNDTLLHRDRRDLCHPRGEALPSMKATPVGPLKSHRWTNGNLTSTSMTPTRSMGWISPPGSAKADFPATKTLKVWILCKSHSGSSCTKAYTTHGSAVLPTVEKLSSFLSTT